VGAVLGRAPKLLFAVTPSSKDEAHQYLAFCKELRKKGWRVGLLLHKQYEGIAQGYYDELFPLEGDPSAYLSSPRFKTAILSGSKLDIGKAIQEEMANSLATNMPIEWDAFKNFQPDAILSGFNTLSEFMAMAQKAQIPVFLVVTSPINPTKQLAPPAVFSEPLGSGILNKFVHWLSFKLVWASISTKINQFRKNLELPSQDDFQFEDIPQFCIFSEHVVRRPTDWPQEVHVSGYWRENVPEGFNPPDSVNEFLTSGSRPFYIDFGNMPIQNEDSLTTEIIKVMDSLQMRAILGGSWVDQIKVPLPANILTIKEISYEWILKKCCVAIHDGEPGITGACFRTGLPQVIFPVLLEQPFWAWRASVVGVAPKTSLLLKDLTAEVLEKQIKDVIRNEMVREQTKIIAEKLHKENGMKNAADILEKKFLDTRNCGITMNWQKDQDAAACNDCKSPFTFTNRRHHCRSCGSIYCVNCLALRKLPCYSKEQMICKKCWNQRNETEGASKTVQ